MKEKIKYIVKIAIFNDETKNETEIKVNEFLATLDGNDVQDIKFTEMSHNYSVMVIYREKIQVV